MDFKEEEYRKKENVGLNLLNQIQRERERERRKLKTSKDKKEY